MFVYEKDGGLVILMTGNKPLVEGEGTPDVEIMPVEGEDGVITASVKINGEAVSVAEAASAEDTGADEGAEGTEDAGAAEGTDEGDGSEL